MITLYKNILLFLIILLPTILFSQKISVLYLGNSHTFWHDLPQLTANLALANGDTIEYESNTPGGCTLAHPSNGHLFNNISLTLIDSQDWDYVVLQEHSLFAVIDHYKNSYTYPGARALDSLIKQNSECTKTIMQLIWAKKYGGQHCINTYCSLDFDNFSHMQDSLTSEYLKLSDSISSITAPTGVAWQYSIENGDPIELFDPDSSHPSLAGHYLTACVYYAVMFKKSPEGIQYFGGLNHTQALYLQQIADEVVFSNPELWGIIDEYPEAGFSYEQNENTVSFIDESINASSYHWEFGDGTIDSTQNPVHAYSESGQFIVTQTVGVNCLYDKHVDTLEIVITDNSFQYNAEEIIQVYHNSVSSQLNVKVTGAKIRSIIITNLTGSVVYNKKLAGDSFFKYNTENLNPGLYIVTLTTKNKRSSWKFVK